MKTLLLTLGVILCGLGVFAQHSFSVNTDQISMVFTIGKDKKLYQSYLGKRLTADFAGEAGVESYAAGGGTYLFEPAIRVVQGDGNGSLDLEVSDVKVENIDMDRKVTRVFMKDPVYAVTVTLELTAYAAENVITSRVSIANGEKEAVRVTNFASSMLHFKASDYWLTQWHGDWAREMHEDESRLTSGIKIIDSKLGSRADMYATPVFMLSLDRPATETSGELIAGTLAWSGNFQFLFERDEKEQLSVLAGMNPYASDYILDAGKVLETPAFVFTWSDRGKGQASRNLHHWASNYGVLNGRGPRKTLLNNWEATQFDFNEKRLVGLIGETKLLGADLFLLDDGWFGNKYPRNDDRAGLGDWQENKAKLPNGIGVLEKAAKQQGVGFGIWIEPEMVNPKSELYALHPDWILKLSNRKENYFRNQLVLDLVNPAVQDFVFKTMDDLLGQHPGISYVKWDCNRMMTNAWSPYLKERQSNLYIDYVRGLYSVLDRLRSKYPAIPMMLCSGGGGRTDYGGLKYFTEFWPSDNTDAVDRVYIQWGYSYFFPALAVSCHVTSWGSESLKFRTDVAMMGRMGYDLNVEKMTASDLAFSQQALKTYSGLNAVIWHGDLYRLEAPYGQERASLMYVDSVKSRAVLFSYTLHPRYGENWAPVRLQGLDAGKKYILKEVNLYPGSKSRLAFDGKAFTGEYLMNAGLEVSSPEALTSSVIEINEVK